MRDSWFSRRVHPEGLEPSTNGLRGHCSTNWATSAYLKFSLRFSKNKKRLKKATISVAINFVHVLYLWASFWWIFLKEVLKKEDDKWIKVDIKLIQLFEKASGWR